jgi:transketolase C-terminal domain/subunit
MRRIAVGHQERLEAIASADGWLSDGHGLDLTMMATAANFETRTNGATHMANDDATIFDGMAHLKIIDVSCPQQLLSILGWIMQGNRGLVYLRLMRTPSAVIYGTDYVFQFGKGSVLRGGADDRAAIVSSGRGVHEALAAASMCEGVTVVDMPSIDEELLVELYDSGKPVLIAEQNNGFIWQNLLKVLYKRRGPCAGVGRIAAVNALDADMRPQFIHSATYEELIDAFELSGPKLARRLQRLMEEAR